MENKNDMHSKTFWVLLVIAFIGAIVCCIAIWEIKVDTNESVQLTETPITTTPKNDAKEKVVDTSNWKTYSNPAYNFTLQYPPELTVEETKDSIIFQDATAPHYTKVEFKKQRTTLPTIVGKYGASVSAIVDNHFSQAVSNIKTIHFFTGDAYSFSRLYIFASDFPRDPGDNGDRPMNIITAKFEGSISDAELKDLIEEPSTAVNAGQYHYPQEKFLDTFRFIKENQ